jgi:hypothetical protein
VPPRLVSGLQRPLPPPNAYADSGMLDGLRSRAFENIATLVRDEAARQAARSSPENLPMSVMIREPWGSGRTPRREPAASSSMHGTRSSPK